jgi:hypothetical protein
MIAVTHELVYKPYPPLLSSSHDDDDDYHHGGQCRPQRLDADELHTSPWPVQLQAINRLRKMSLSALHASPAQSTLSEPD